ncbi:bifunctional 3-(3-hydroxy-phenyl)propionate/3-hydroxycinnamic acid hydroxylase [Microbacterium sp. B19]|uniref:bifunctional 3-(3-hydroxy-phenyl)propionate/3-hydroxycinnamic acid hydroxylase MhpA n=1 Tax=Microbacterium sp. B19 TaxID=96765 RepID=UPI000344A715|nr:bifunctional 3-(3-hydroxy-phenyl)propionate/3-hydroxycinnamic acid hydroxylase [Microbacterium sp. B19]
MTDEERDDVDVVIVGAGPTGLSLANLLGLQGISVTVLEALPSLIDYPRGVGIDDESLRSLQTMGLVDLALPHTTPAHIMRLVNGKGRQITEIRPTTDEFGWSRRNAFIQPEVDRVLYEGLARFHHVQVLFGHTLDAITDDAHGVTVAGTTADDEAFHLRAAYLVGADGGRSRTRKHIGVSFDGQSPSTRWLVIDVRNDPLGTPNIYLGGDPRRPYVSLGLPQGLRRFEFMLFDDEPDVLVDDTAFLAKLLAPHVPDPATLDIVRARVYTHHSRIAGDFRRGRVFLAGDAAHLMPVWQGQGWNSGERDATNLAWKLAAVIAGRSDDRLLDTYATERRDHAKAMIDLSTAFGRVVKPTNPLVAGVRDVAASALHLFPASAITSRRCGTSPCRATGRASCGCHDLDAGRSDRAGDLEPARAPHRAHQGLAGRHAVHPADGGHGGRRGEAPR